MAFVDEEMEKRSDPRYISEVEATDVPMHPSHRRTSGREEGIVGGTLEGSQGLFGKQRTLQTLHLCAVPPEGGSMNQVVSRQDYRSHGEQLWPQEIRGKKNGYAQGRAGCWPGLERGVGCLSERGHVAQRSGSEPRL